MQAIPRDRTGTPDRDRARTAGRWPAPVTARPEVGPADREGMAGDRAGDLAGLFEEHHRRVYQAAYRVTGNASDAEDVLQTVFLRLLRRDRLPELSGNPAGYLHMAAVNGALDVVRSRAAARSGPIEEAEQRPPSTPEAGPEARLDDRRMRERVRQGVARLGPRMAEAFVLRYFEGYRNTEIARMLGVSRTAVAVLLHRARARLRKELLREPGFQAGGRP